MRLMAVVFGSLLMVAAGGARAQEGAGVKEPQGFFADLVAYRTLDLGRVERNFADALEFPVDGVVESAIAQLAMVKLAQPLVDSDELKDRIDDLSEHGRTPAIRFKAYLTRMVFEQPQLFEHVSRWSYANGDQLFMALARSLESSTLATN